MAERQQGEIDRGGAKEGRGGAVGVKMWAGKTRIQGGREGGGWDFKEGRRGKQWGGSN